MTTDPFVEQLLGRTVTAIEPGFGWFVTVRFDFRTDSSGDFLWIQQGAWRIRTQERLIVSCVDEIDPETKSLASELVGQTITTVAMSSLDLTLGLNGYFVDVFGLFADNNWDIFLGDKIGGPSLEGFRVEPRLRP